MADTYRMIIENATNLFNEKGVKGTTMRDIAEACGIVVGNVTYYFPKKIDLVQAILKDSIDRVDKTVEIQTFEAFYDLLFQMDSSMMRHRFALLEPLAYDYPRFSEDMDYLYTLLDNSLVNLRNNGLIEMSDKQKTALINTYVLSPIAMVGTTRFLNNKDMSIGELADQQMELLKAFEVKK